MFAYDWQAGKYGKVSVVYNGLEDGASPLPPNSSQIEVTESLDYIAFCANETVHGMSDAPLIAPAAAFPR